MLPHQQRVLDERNALEEKITKLDEFLSGTLIETLPEEDQELLAMQQTAMIQYIYFLDQRIKRF